MPLWWSNRPQERPPAALAAHREDFRYGETTDARPERPQTLGSLVGRLLVGVVGRNQHGSRAPAVLDHQSLAHVSQSSFDLSDMRPVPRIQDLPYRPFGYPQTRRQSDIGESLVTHRRVERELCCHYQWHRNRDLPWQHDARRRDILA